MVTIAAECSECALIQVQTIVLIGTGVAHIVLYFMRPNSPTRIPVGAFGLAYLGVGLWSVLSPETDLRPVVVGAAVCGIGFILGLVDAFRRSFTAADIFLLAVDVVIVTLGLLILK